MDELLKLFVAMGLDPKLIEKTISEGKKKENLSLLEFFEQANILPEEKLLKVFSEFYKIDAPDFEASKISTLQTKLLKKEIAEKWKIFPIEKQGNFLIYFTSDPKNIKILDAIRFGAGCNGKPVLALSSKINQAIQQHYGQLDVSSLENSSSPKPQDSISANTRTNISSSIKGDGPIIKIVNDVLIQCLTKKASDIHIECYEEHMRIRLRIDGVLVEIARPPVGMKGALISRIKIMAGLNIAESRLPQDGAINVTVGQTPIDFRVNSLPTVYGEKIVMRILDKSNLQVDMTQLGFEADQLADFKKAIKNPHGMVLVTGPTGSGKTTTLYSALQELNDEETNVITAEDPVEYSLEGINQVQMKPDIGLNFSTALRAFLRQDPDVIMVGEIRDLETVEIAMKAALTGHMVLSTLHTNSAPDTISRLLNMGAAPFNVVSALACVTAQRLMRKICPKCRIEDDSITETVLIELGISPEYAAKIKVFKGQGCENCGNSGQKGRIAVHEVLVLNEAVKRSILNGEPAIDIKRVAMESGMRSLRQSALAKMAQGIVSAHEVVKVTSSDKE